MGHDGIYKADQEGCLLEREHIVYEENSTQNIYPEILIKANEKKKQSLTPGAGVGVGWIKKMGIQI